MNLDAIAAFLEDMGERPTGSTIDRINNDLGYFKENCRWATAAEQARNRRSNRLITFNGKTQCATDWNRELGFPKLLILIRLGRGWSEERALTTPPRRWP